MAIKDGEIPDTIQANWPYNCVVSVLITPELWKWLYTHMPNSPHKRWMWDYILKSNGDISFKTWFGFKSQEDMMRFMLTWS